MASSNIRVPVAGSDRAPRPGAKLVGAVNPREKISVTILLRRRPGSKSLAAKAAQIPAAPAPTIKSGTCAFHSPTESKVTALMVSRAAE